MNTYSFRKDLISVQEELLRFAYKLTADKEEANDLLQETSLKALDNEDKYMPDTNFKGWMYTIMRNIFINNYRRIVREQTFVDQTDNLYHLNLPQNSGFANAEGSYDLKEMHRIVNSLPRDYKVPFSMHVSGFKYREIHIGISVVMTDQIADAVDNGGAETEGTEQFFSGFRSFLFLQLAVAVAILFFGRFNPDIVYNCGGFQNKLGIALQILRQPNQTREAVNLDKVLNPFRIAGVVANHFH